MTDRELLEQILAEMQGVKEKLNEIDKKVDRNYDLTLEFYGSQKEHNTEVSDTLDILSGEMEMHNNQIAKNTAALKRYK